MHKNLKFCKNLNLGAATTFAPCVFFFFCTQVLRCMDWLGLNATVTSKHPQSDDHWISTSAPNKQTQTFIYRNNLSFKFIWQKSKKKKEEKKAGIRFSNHLIQEKKQLTLQLQMENLT